MTIHKIKSGRIPTIVADEYIGERGTIFYNELIGDLRRSDGKTVGGIPIISGLTENMAYAERIDFVTDDLFYRGKAIPGSIDSAAIWQIEKVTFNVDGIVTIEWADGDALFTKVWDNHLSLTYI